MSLWDSCRTYQEIQQCRRVNLHLGSSILLQNWPNYRNRHRQKKRMKRLVASPKTRRGKNQRTSLSCQRKQHHTRLPKLQQRQKYQWWSMAWELRVMATYVIHYSRAFHPKRHVNCDRDNWQAGNEIDNDAWCRTPWVQPGRNQLTS